MKKGLFVLVGVALVIAACSGSKNLVVDNEPLLKVTNPHWFKVMPGQEDGEKFNVLILPVVTVLESYQVDSVYFQGFHEELQLSGYEGKTVYRAQLFEKRKPTSIDPPVEISENQALMSYMTPEKEKKYILIENIVQGETIFMP